MQHRRLALAHVTFAALAPLALACGSPATTGFTSFDAGATPDATSLLGGGDGGLGELGSPDGAASHQCNATSLDLAGCPCTSDGASRACYSGDTATRNVGTCKDGTQTCTGSAEAPQWSACTGEVLPATESCSPDAGAPTGTNDTNCNGKTGCADPTCASNATCNTACTNGQTRACYDGPTGSENVGICKDGTQVCANGAWPTTCAGEVTPQPENCCDALDHNCNHLPGCFDILFCLTATCCQSSCTAQNVDAGCVCPQGQGDTATCPGGDFGVHAGGFPGVDECCPCTANDCGNSGCCAETVCAGSSACSGLTCSDLPASCNGQVNSDCDDFPEDCDEPCCKCRNCP